MPLSPINKVTANASGNFAAGVGKFDFGKIRGVIIHPNDADLLSTANVATAALRKTGLQNLLINQTYGNRAFFIHKLMMPTNNGEGPGRETIEQFKKLTDKGTWDKTFMVDGTYAEYQMLRNFHLRKGYSIAFIDDNNVVKHLNTDTGICGLAIHELEVEAIEDPETGKAVKYKLRIALTDIDEYNTAKHTELGFNPFHPISGIKGVEDTVITDVSAKTVTTPAAATFHISLKSADSQTNLVPKYAAILNVPSAWKFVNSAGAAITIASVAVISEGTEKVAFALTCTATGNYVAADVAVLTQADIATLAGLGVKYHEAAPISITLT